MLRALARHWELKLLSVLLAGLLWVFVVGGGRSRLTLTVPVEYVGPGPDYVLISDPRDRVDVHLEAARWAAGRATPDTVRVRVNLARLREGQHLVAVSPDDVVAPPGLTVMRIAPARLPVTVARAVEEALQVVPHLQGAPAPGFAVVRVAVSPAVVQVKGPRSTIEGRRTVETAPVDVSGGRDTVTQTVGLVLPEFAYPTRGGSVQVTVEIRPKDARGGERR